MHGTDLLEIICARLEAAGFEIDNEDDEYSDVLDALDKVMFVKKEHVPLVVIEDYVDSEGSYVWIGGAIYVGGEQLCLYGNQLNAEDADAQDINALVEEAKAYADERGYQFENRINIEEYQ